MNPIIGKTVKGIINRPIGCCHLRYTDYGILYGYVEVIIAGDGQEQDIYVFGTEKTIKTFEGKHVRS